MGFVRTALPSGIRVLSEVVEGQRGVSLGVWLGTGSRDETDEMCGVSHFLEHLVFKGTPSRTALDIAQTFDAIGGDLNAFTTKEFICFHARAVGAELRMCMETIADIVSNASLAKDDVEAERNVVLEEIAMHDDAPDDAVFDLYMETLWEKHGLGRPVQGRQETIRLMQQDAIAAHYAARFGTAEIVVAASGAIDHAELCDLSLALFGEGARSLERPQRTPPPAAQARVGVNERDTEQVHLVYGCEGLARGDERRWALEVLNIAIGGGMSSRLSQEVREKRGLVYSINSGLSAFAETGLFTIYAGCSPDRVRDVLRITREQLGEVASGGITDEERARAISHLTGSLTLSLDDPGSRMSHLAKSELLLGEVLTHEQIVERVSAVTQDQLRDVARHVLGDRPWSLAMNGPVTEKDARGLMEATA